MPEYRGRASWTCGVMPTLRRAAPSDAVAIAALLGELGYPATVELVRGKLAGMATSPVDDAYVAAFEGRLVGCISLHVFELFHSEGRLGRITSLVVDSSARGAGIGTQLVAAAEAYFLEKGCVRAEVTSADHRSVAHAFYERRGYAVTGRRYGKHLRT
jgi:GNAT superfamily N-acetyltransferase